jgi:hypothetical protein
MACSVIQFKSKEQLALDDAQAELAIAMKAKESLTGMAAIDGEILKQVIVAQMKVTFLKQALKTRGLL